MRKTVIAMAVLLAIVATSSCKKNGDKLSSPFENRSTAAIDYTIACSLPIATVNADITTNTTWAKDSVYEISGVVTVRNGAKLTIQAGTFIKSSLNTPGVANGVLVISKTGKIQAVGTPTEPIVFTSRRLLDCITATYGIPGDFGGVIILGDARVNTGDKLIEGLPDDPKFHFGGYDEDDNRGTFQYVRIEFAGFKLAENVEVNGLTLGGVGCGTTIDHVQVSYGTDDGFEFFGGSVNPSHLISLAAEDDQFDFDNGYRGNIKYAIGVVDAYVSHSGSNGVSDANGIESDNNAPAEDATFRLRPRTHPTLDNFSIIGVTSATLNPPIFAPGLKNAFTNRRGAEVTVNKSLFTGFSNGIVFEADANANQSCGSYISVHGFGAAVSVAAGSFTAPGLLTSTAATAESWNMVQPFYNNFFHSFGFYYSLRIKGSSYYRFRELAGQLDQI